MRNVALQPVGNLMIAVYNENPPTNTEHLEVLSVFRSLDLERTRCLTVTKGGAPTAAQRKDLTEALGGRQFRSAVVTNAHFVRGIVTALSWFNSEIRAFSKEQMQDALKYLDVPPESWEEVLATVKRLEADVQKPASTVAKNAASR
jgi:hypothetical protein